MNRRDLIRGLVKRCRMPSESRTPDANFRGTRRAIAERMQAAWQVRDVEMTCQLAMRLVRLGVSEGQIEKLMQGAEQ